MGKFNKDKLRGLDLNEEEARTGSGYKVGSGLLNDVSKSEGMEEEDIIYLRRDQIERNEKNHYSINGIESLAWSIENMGLIQPLHVTPGENGKYKLLGGERRLTAIDQLIADPKVEQWTEETLIRCVEKAPETISLPLPDSLKEALMIITTNKESRDYTDADRIMELKEWKKIIAALREKGIKRIPYVDPKTGEQELVIKGSTRDLLAKTTGMSRGFINKMENLEAHGSQALKEAVMAGETSINTANEMINHLDEKGQEEMLAQAEAEGVTITPQMIQEKAIQQQKNVNVITAERFKLDIREILKCLRKEDCYLDEAELQRYQDCLEQLQEILCM